MRINKGRLLTGGLAGTVAMTVVMYYLAPPLAGKALDVGAMLAGMMHTGWAWGISVHFILGMFVFPALFASFFYRRLPGPPWVRGALFGVVLWVVAEMFVMPVAGMGMFQRNGGGTTAVLLLLFGHLVYGALLGGITARPAADAAHGTRSVVGDLSDLRRGS